jgi:hypothetical protein
LIDVQFGGVTKFDFALLPGEPILNDETFSDRATRILAAQIAKSL